MPTSVPVSASVYYQDRYWNGHELVLDFFQRRMSGGTPSTERWWHRYFLEEYLQGRPVERALCLNCGNGWLERELIDLGLAKSVVGFDYSEELLAQARAAAGERAITYFQADCNTIELEPDSFDLVVNYAAMHHVQWIDRVQRMIARALTRNGYYVNFDYIGPHRNQYGSAMFGRMRQVNELLPRAFRKEPLDHPEISSMILADPTEAIHSELIFPTFERYFYPLERKDLNGGIAYQIMHNNAELYLPGQPAARRSVEFLLEVDELCSEFAEVPPLFSFFIGRPRKALFDGTHEQTLSAWSKEETARETAAAANGGLYPGVVAEPI